MRVLKDVFFKESKHLLSKRLNKWYATFKTGHSKIKLILKPYVYHKRINTNAMNNLSEESTNISKLYTCNFLGLVIIAAPFICMQC